MHDPVESYLRIYLRDHPRTLLMRRAWPCRWWLDRAKHVVVGKPFYRAFRVAADYLVRPLCAPLLH